MKRIGLCFLVLASGCATSRPYWTPTAVVAQMVGDHAQVVIQYPRGVAWRQKPAIMVDGAVNDCHYVPETYTHVCDGLFNKALIKVGSAETGYRKVLIRRAKEAAE